MKKALFLLPAFVTACFIVPPAFAEVRGGAFTVSPFVGGYTFDGIQHLKTNVAAGLGLGYNLSEHWGVEGVFSYVPLRSTYRGISTKGDQYNLRGDLLYHFMPKSQFVPFVALGGGWSKTKKFFGNNEDATIDYGAGMKYFLTDWLALRGDVRHRFLFHSPNYGGTNYWQNVEYTVGLTFQLGGARTAAPPVESAKTTYAAPSPPAVTAQEVKEPAPAPAPAPPVKAVQASEPAPAREAPAPPTAVQRAKTASPDVNPVVTGIAVGSDGVDIFATGWIGDVTPFRLTGPARLVIDIPGAVSGLGTKRVPLNSLGFAAARIGVYPDHLRIVLDASGQKLPRYLVVATETGLKVLVEDGPQKR